MKSKKSLTESILKKLSSNINEIDNTTKTTIEDVKDKVNKENNLKDNSEVKLDTNSFIMVPINHPKINEIIKLLNSIQEENKSIDNSNKEEKRLVITLNDILSSKDEKLITPKNSIITPMARDYIKQKKIEVIFDENKDE
ncbi:hypothetical protein [Romboutsia sp.]|uniref:hypothetical protein n=1 Tax=Romboutsia sp. TaxID=1965302 RepID=UPI002BC016E5|nr:hypothetical protein [Romboutsia sp.]HSQ89102.1 hypothetical protein [Romboutsia sp.]